MSDVVARAKAALEEAGQGYTAADWLKDCRWPDRDADFAAAARPPIPELVAEVERLRDLKPRLEAFGRDCVTNGDMTPGAARMLDLILERSSLPGPVGEEADSHE